MSSRPVDEPIEDFIASIKGELEKGYGFTPFIGAGVSAASGMMIGSDFDEYLVYAIYRCVAPDDEQPIKKRWDLLRDGWLRRPTGSQYEEATEWLGNRLSELRRALAKDPADTKRFTEIDLRAAEILKPRFVADSEWPGVEEGPQLKEHLERHAAEKSAWKAQIESACRHWECLDGRVPDRDLEIGLKQLAATWEGHGINRAEGECAVLEKALRSLYDWKAMLTFLSHLELDGDTLTFQKTGNPLIIDRFNLHITWGQKPNLAHTQLVHLARPLRIRQIFTTNFDTLMEQAFQEVQIPLRLIETTIGTGLPDETLVLGANCLVKFHGGAQQTRADFSLNEPATPEDKARFVSYLRQRRKIGNNDNCCHVPNHLLLLGLSGSDWRVIDLLQHALWSLPELKVFIIANSDSSLNTFDRRLKGWAKDGQLQIFKLGRADLALLRLYQELTLTLPPGGFSSQFTQYVPAGEPDENFGHLTYKDFAVRTIAALENARPHEPEKNFGALKLPVKPEDAHLVPDIEKWLELARPAYRARTHKEEKRKSKGIKSSWIAVATGHSGIMRFFQALFDEEVRKRKQCVWLELEDYGSCEELTAEFLRVLSLNRGRYQTAHIDLDRRPNFKDKEDLEDFSGWIGRVMDYLDLDASECSLFLYGRNGAGGCSRLRAGYWGADDYKRFETLLDILFMRGFRVYYLPFSEDRWIRNQRKEGVETGDCGIQQRIDLVRKSADPLGAEAAAYFKEFRSGLWPEGKSVTSEGFIQRLPDSIVHRYGEVANQPSPKLGASDTVNSEFENRIDQICANFIIDPGNGATRSADESAWESLQKLVSSDTFAKNVDGTKEDTPWTRVQFLYACSLFRQSRHPSGLISEGSFACPFSFNVNGEDNDMLRSRIVRNWTDRLREIKLFRDKPGGFLWQYRDTRLGIQAILESLTSLKLGQNKELEFLGQRRSRLHFWIGEWYRDAFMATRHVVPMIESLYHRAAAIHFARWAKPSYLERGKPDVAKFRLHLVLASLTEIVDLLELGAPEAGFWQPGTTGGEIFSRQAILSAIDWTSPPANGTAEREKQTSEWVAKIIGIDPAQVPGLQTYVDTVARMLSSLEVSAQSISGRLQAEDSPGFSMQIRTNMGAAFFGTKEIPSVTPVISRLWLKNEQGNTVNSLLSIAERTFGKVDPDAWHWIYDFEGIRIEDDHGKNGEEEDVRKDRERRVARSRNLLAQAILTNSSNAFEALQSMAEAAYIGIKITKLKSRHVKATRKPGQPEVGDRLRWVRVSMICSVGLSLLRVCHSASIEDRILLRQKFLAFYALALGFLGRFHEAHRRLNQANALCRFIPRYQSEMATIILRIRRSEIHLAEAESLSGDTVNDEGLAELILARRISAKVDDAVVSLEAAEHLMQGRSQSSLWWGRFYSLRLRAIAMSATLAEKHPDSSSERVVSLALRRRHDYYSTIREIFGRADLLCQEDTYRHIRTIDYTIKAIIGVFSISGTQIKPGNFLRKLRDEHSKLADDLASAYERMKVRHRVEGKDWCPEFLAYYKDITPFFPGL